MPARILFVAAAIALAGAILWATMGPTAILESVAAVMQDRWGVVMLADLYAGFLAATALFFLVERPLVALALFVLLMVLGNVVTLLWLAFRAWPRLAAAIGPGGRA